MDRLWLDMRHTDYQTYKDGVREWLNWAFDDDRKPYRSGPNYSRIYCPCSRCMNAFSSERETVFEHLICNGWWPCYTNWIAHGEEIFDPHRIPDHTVDPFDSRRTEEVVEMMQEMHNDGGNGYNEFMHELKSAEESIAPGTTGMSRLSFLLKLFQIKVMNRATAKLMSDVLVFIGEVLNDPIGYPKSWYEAKKCIRALGLKSEKIDSCVNDCMLYWEENQHLQRCPHCDAARYKGDELVTEIGRRQPQKVLRYFPLIPRLQRLYMSSKTAKWMTWHASNKPREGVMSHPSDAEEWISFNNKYPNFAAESRNIRLGLASDGFNPFKNMYPSYSIWPVVIVNYNMPPRMCMLPSFMMLTLIIPGPTAHGNAIEITFLSLLSLLPFSLLFLFPLLSSSSSSFPFPPHHFCAPLPPHMLPPLIAPPTPSPPTFLFPCLPPLRSPPPLPISFFHFPFTKTTTLDNSMLRPPQQLSMLYVPFKLKFEDPLSDESQIETQI